MSISQLEKLAAEIGIKPNMPAVEARSQILKQLASSSFTPSDSWRCVATRYAGASPKRLPSEQAQKNLEEKEVGTAVEAFATQYFFLNPEKRRKRWEDLNERAKPYARIRMRIGMLERGLDLEIPKEYQNDRQKSVMEYVRQLYPLKHADRIKARPEVLNSLPLKRPELEELIANPSQKMAKWVNLEEGLFFFPFDEEIDGYRFEDAEANFDQPEPVGAPRSNPRPKPKKRSTGSRKRYDDDYDRDRRAPSGNGNTATAGFFGGIGFAVLVVVLFVVRVALREASRPSSTNTSSNYSSPSSYSPPSTNFNPPISNPPISNPPGGGMPKSNLGGGPSNSNFGNTGGGINPPIFPQQPIIPQQPTFPQPGPGGISGFPSQPGPGGISGFPKTNTGGISGFPSTPGPGGISGFPKTNTGGISGFPSQPGPGGISGIPRGIRG